MDYIYKYQKTCGFNWQSSIRNYKYVIECNHIKKKLQKKLASDIYSLYEKSEFVDLRLETSGGNICCHSFIIKSRFSRGWDFIYEIEKLQNIKRLRNDRLLIVYLPEITFSILETFIRSLYKCAVDEAVAQSLIALLELHLYSLKSALIPCERRVYLEKLSEEDERTIQKLLLNQLKLGEISEQKGNLKVLSHCFSSAANQSNSDHSLLFSNPKIAHKSSTVCTNSCNQVNVPHNSLQKKIKPTCLNKNCIDILPAEYFFEREKKFDQSMMSTDNSEITSKKERESNSRQIDLNDQETIVSDCLSNESDSQILKCLNAKYLTKPKTSSDQISSESDRSVQPDFFADTSSVKAKIRQIEQLDHHAHSRQINQPSFAKKISAGDDPSLLTQSLLEDDDGISVSEQQGLHETSSLEVELPSSQEDQSISPDFDKSDHSSESANRLDDDANVIIDDTNINNEDINCSDENCTKVLLPHKPLVRTRTFDLIEATCDAVHVDEPTCDAIHVDEPTEHSSSNTPEKNIEISNFNDTSSEIPVSFNIDTTLSNQGKSNNTVQANYDKLREMERLKGSLLFEHNLQTFSSIPSISSNSQRPILVNIEPIYNCKSKETICDNLTVHPLVTNQPSELIGGTTQISSSATVGEIATNPFINQRLNHTLVPQRSQEEMAIELHNEISKRGPGTRSPSPDSLSLDLPSDTEENLEKESSYVEEKEKDEREDKDQPSPIHEHRKLPNFINCDTLSSSLNSSFAGSPRVLRRSENIPIVSGGSTLRKESLNLKEVNPPDLSNQPIYSGPVKNVDAIPVIGGYTDHHKFSESPDKEQTDENFLKKSDIKKDEGKPVQSIFSMFINFDEIPSPDKELVAKDKNKKSHPTGGLYMFIEADSSSPKGKRKSRIADGNKQNELNKLEVDAEYDFTSKNVELPLLNNENIEFAKIEESARNELADECISKVSEGGLKISENGVEDASNKKSGFFFIEAGSPSKGTSPKLGRRPLRSAQHKSKPDSNVMSKSAPSDCHLFNKDGLSSMKPSTPDSSLKLMTKSVIDREEFMAQPVARRNVSLNDKINESSKIPRPVNNFKEKLITCQKDFDILQKLNKDMKPLKLTPNKRRPKVFEQTKSLEAALPDIGTSLCVSFTEPDVNSLPPFSIEDASEISDVSSLLSSLERSYEPSEHEGKAAHTSSLGNDLLKMLINEINTDVTIQIGEKKIRAHKCILASRCVYFAAMLSGHWVESAGNIIKLQGFSAEAVMEALKHIYSGSSSVPEGVSVGELAALADMLALDGLKDVVSLHLKANKCHYFHKPCTECLPGVLEVLPIAGAYCLDELYHKCLRWVAKNFVAVFPTRNFASLPSELQDRCLKQIMDDMSVSNVIDTALGGEKIVSSLPVVRWAQPVFDLLAQLIEYATNFIATNLSSILASDRFLILGKDGGWNVDSLEETMKMACEMVKPDQAVLSHIQLATLIKGSEDKTGRDYSEAFINMCELLLNQIEKFIIHNLNRVAVCRKWPLLPVETQKRIKDAALIVIEFSKPVAPKPTLSSATKLRSRGTNIEPCTRIRASSMSDHRLSRSASASVVQPSKGTGTKRIQTTVGRCHTPPPSVLRSSLQTPPPTRASTLRAQARQVAIQRSQSARTVIDRPRRQKSHGLDLSIDNEDFSSSSTFSRGGTFTRSLSRSDHIPGRPRSPTLPLSVTSRSSTPGLNEGMCHKRNKSGSIMSSKMIKNEQLLPQPQYGNRDTSTNTKFFRAHSMDVCPKSSSIGASPLHPALTRENVDNLASPSRIFDVKNPNANRNGNLTLVKTGTHTKLQKTKFPLVESQRVWPKSGSMKTGFSQIPPEVKHQFDGEDASSNSSTSGTVGSVTEFPTGLGCRSNTFCKDDVVKLEKLE